MRRALFRLWVVATVVWGGFCWLMLPHGPGMGPAYAFAILVPSLTILVVVGGILWACESDRTRAVRVTEVLPPSGRR
jgi:hypothetical protein